MPKQAKLPQTDWTRGGRDISNAAVPQYTSSINRLGGYLGDPMGRTQQYIDQYYSPSAIQNQDFLRNYNRQMTNRTGANWAATGGGYTSSGQRAYDDQQRYYNDLASRLQRYGVNSARSMYNSDITNEINTQAALNNAYKLGQNYSAIETQNALADQANRNWWSPVLSTVGKVVGSIPHPVTMGIGAAMQGAGAATGIDTSGAYGGMGAIYGGSWNPSQDNTYTNLLNNLSETGAIGELSGWLQNKFPNAGWISKSNANQANANPIGIDSNLYNSIMNAPSGIDALNPYKRQQRLW